MFGSQSLSRSERSLAAAESVDDSKNVASWSVTNMLAPIKLLLLFILNLDCCADGFGLFLVSLQGAAGYSAEFRVVFSLLFG